MCPEFSFLNLCPKVIYKNAVMSGISIVSKDLIIKSGQNMPLSIFSFVALCNNSVMVMLFCGGLLVVRAY